jgi:cytochrome c biogenesis protein CcdA
MLKEVLSGFFVKLITGFDDTITHVPIISSLTRSKKGRLAFVFGIFLAITLAIILSYFFVSLFRSFEYYKYVAAGIIFVLAFLIYILKSYLESLKRKRKRF